MEGNTNRHQPKYKIDDIEKYLTQEGGVEILMQLMAERTLRLSEVELIFQRIDLMDVEDIPEDLLAELLAYKEEMYVVAQN